jgi:2-phosphosulfolactate phosphatase
VEWGPIAAESAAARGDAVVIVDVLSFSTTLTIAAERGFISFVFSGPELAAQGGATAVAARLGAACAVGKRDAPPGVISLSPASVRSAAPGVNRVLFSSLNGALVVAAADGAARLAVASLRNRSAAAGLAEDWLRRREADRLTVVPCGEQWSSVAPADGMRPCVEDYLGAGAVADALAANGAVLSIEAHAAAAVFRGLRTADLTSLVGARELIAAGFAEDVTLAAQIDVCERVPVRDERCGRRCFVPRTRVAR